MRFQNLAFGAALLYSQQIYALSNLTYYSDDLCTDVITEKNGPDDGTCTQFPTMSRSYASFRVSSLDQTCSGKASKYPARIEYVPPSTYVLIYIFLVTIYGNDTAFCSSTINLRVAPFGDCITDMSVNQFSVDCQDYSVAISSPPDIYAGSTPEPVDDSSGGLSAGAKAGIGVAAAAVVIILVGLIVFFVIRNNRRKRGHPGIAEADSHPAAAPPYSELPPDEKKNPVELPPQHMIPVEAPGDHAWPTRELEAAVVQSKIMASTHQASNLKSLNRRQSDSDITPINASVNGESATSMSNTFSPVSPEDTATATSTR